ncbi:MAG: TRAM domain-containing protein, partial [Candidatus Omnitrophica bacterium]|nr:TRAM domain-containing protein [Candidatus Omnitrophota bacterium]
FLDGIYILPKFVLDELQNIADSPDPSRRQRGRRGLDTVRALKDTDMIMEISEKDYPHIQAVDAKLIQCAKDLEGRIVTNDFNLNKVAEINNIPVLNINDLSNALKPVILPGETLTLTLLKSGKEPGQGIGYLDDGTMVVVEDGIARLRDEVDVTVTSMLQTQAGRMIFGRLADSEEAPRRERESEESDRKESARKVVDLELKKK